MPTLSSYPALIPIALILSLHPLQTASISLQNITISAPVGTTQHGDNHLLCVPAQTWDILSFFAANYLAHAATVRLYPGESSLEIAWALVAAILFPTSGMIRGLSAAIRRGFFAGGGGEDIRQRYFGGTPLNIAARSGALCMVVRTKDWKPVPGTRLSQVAVTIKDPEPAISPTDSSRNRFFSQIYRPDARTLARYPELDHTPYAYAYALLPNMFPPSCITSQLSRSVDLLREGLAAVLVEQSPPALIPERIQIPTTAHVPLPEVLGAPGTNICAPYRTYVPEWLKDVPWGLSLPETTSVMIGDRKVHGKHNLPDGYALAFVPRTAEVVPLEGDYATVPDPQRGVIKGLVSLAQAMYAFYTLFQARGDQISRYGYAAFGLTVLPYAVMSTVNLISALLTPEFDALYLVQSDTLLEARDRQGAKFEGLVGTLLPVFTTPPDIPRLMENVFSGIVESNGEGDGTGGGPKLRIASYPFVLSTTQPNPTWEGLLIEIPACGEFQRYDKEVTRLRRVTNAFSLVGLTLALNVLMYSVIFGMTMPRHGKSWGGTGSSLRQRVFLVLWLVLGSVMGFAASWSVLTRRMEGREGEVGHSLHRFLTTNLLALRRFSRIGIRDRLTLFFLETMAAFLDPRKAISEKLNVLVGGVPAIGGFYFVAQMLREYGICTKYD